MRAVLSSLLLLAALPASAATVTTIDVPGAVFTSADSISPSGIVAGAYAPSGGNPCGACGFVRTTDGTFHTFSAVSGNVLEVTAVLDDRTTVGNYIKGHNVRGFFRAPNGTFSDIFFHKTNTMMKGLNSSDIAVGNANSGFTRAPDGTLKFVKLRGCTDIGAVGIDAAGTVAGNCLRNDKSFGYLRALDGSYKLVKHSGWKDIGVNAVDHTGAVAGFYTDQNLGKRRCYVRDADGTFHGFDIPGDNPVNTYIIAMNLVGSDRQIVGWLQAGDQRYYGFIVHGDGTNEVFDVSGGHATQTGTFVEDISPSGAVVGNYTGDDQKRHGFMRAP